MSVKKNRKSKGHLVANGFKSGTVEGGKSKGGIQWGNWGTGAADPSFLGYGLAQRAESCSGLV